MTPTSRTAAATPVTPSATPVVDLDPTTVFAIADSLVDLQRASYAVEARLIGDDRIPTLHEGVPELLAARLSWSAALDGSGTPLGAIGWLLEGDALDIDRLMVRPDAQRRGIGRRLVAHALAKAPRATVATGRDNAPARALYERAGFEALDEVEVEPGLWIVRYARHAG